MNLDLVFITIENRENINKNITEAFFLFTIVYIIREKAKNPHEVIYKFGFKSNIITNLIIK